MKNSLMPMRRVPLLVTVLTCLNACHGDTNVRADKNTEIDWPLGRGGAEMLVLSVPHGYGELNQAAEAMNNSVYPGKQSARTRGVYRELLLQALWPGMEPDESRNRAEFNQPGGGKLMVALLHTGAMDDFSERHFDAMQMVFDLAINDSVHNLCVTKVESDGGSHAHCFTRESPDVKQPKFGLLRIGVDFSKYPNFPEGERSILHARDIFYSRDGQGRLKTVILCDAEEAKTIADGPQYHVVPQCEHDFVSERLNAYISLHYRRAYLADWGAVEGAWRNLLESFVVTKNDRHSN